jgi:protein-S-isoprenylcysteine O-methyltransferase Ste14
MFKAYQWQNSKLKKRAQLYNWLTVLVMALILACLYLWSANYAALVFVGIGLYLMMLSGRIQNEDRNLKKQLKETQDDPK